MYELLLNWMCTQENLIDEAETIVRLEMLVGSAPSCVKYQMRALCAVHRT